ncbi:MAG TPA: hypothetical protein VMM76_11155 [Pirellulaceae bacterium]|nr:hypothetical protein [Pirellulaceae bacterium]
MPRTKRVAPGGMVFPALNRGVGRRKMFTTDRDYSAFEETVEETLRLYPMRILGYCWLPNHWHFVLWPEEAGQLSAFLPTWPTKSRTGRMNSLQLPGYPVYAPDRLIRPPNDRGPLCNRDCGWRSLLWECERLKLTWTSSQPNLNHGRVSRRFPGRFSERLLTQNVRQRKASAAGQQTGVQEMATVNRVGTGVAHNSS